MPASFEEDEEEEDEGDKGRGMREVIQTSVSDRELAEVSCACRTEGVKDI